MPNNGNIIIISFWYSNQLKAYKQVFYTTFLLLKSVKISWLSKVSISQQVLTTMRHITKTLSTPKRSRMIQGDIELYSTASNVRLQSVPLEDSNGGFLHHFSPVWMAWAQGELRHQPVWIHQIWWKLFQISLLTSLHWEKRGLLDLNS